MQPAIILLHSSDGSCMHDRVASKSVPGSRVPYLVNEHLDAAV